MSSTVCYSLGYQRRSIADLCASLAAKQVEVLLDVRAVAFSHRPEYRKRALADALRAHGIEYVHVPDAGNPFRATQGARKPDPQWRAKYAAYVAGHRELIDRIGAAVRARPSALLCYEADPGECHRTVLLDAVSRHLGELVVENL